jgi:pentatricopeptide repeat protein
MPVITGKRSASALSSASASSIDERRNAEEGRDDGGRQRTFHRDRAFQQLAIPRIGIVTPPCVVDVFNFPSLLNTAPLPSCECLRPPQNRALHDLVKSASKTGLMAEATAMFWADWAAGARDQNQCVSFIMQLCREEMIPEALRVLNLMYGNNVSRTWRVFDAVIKHMRTHKQVPYADEIIATLRLLPANCIHVREHFGELFTSGLAGLAVRDEATEDRLADCLCLVDVWLRQTDATCRELACGLETWAVLLRCCMERRQAIAAIALWRRMLLIVPAVSSSLFDMLIRTIVYTLEDGDLTRQVAVAFVVDEPLAQASAAQLHEFAVTTFTEWPRSVSGFKTNTSVCTLMLSSALRFEHADFAARVFEAVFSARDVYERDEHTIVQMFRTLTSLAREPMIVRTAQPLLQQAREQQLLSSGAVASFMVTQLIVQNFAATLALYEELKATKELPLDEMVCGQVLKAVRCDKNDVGEMERLFKEMCALGVVPDVVMINQMQKSYLDHGRIADAERCEAMKVGPVAAVDVVSRDSRVRLMCARGELDDVVKELRAEPEPNSTAITYVCKAVADFARFDLVPAVIELALSSKREVMSSYVVTSLIRLCGTRKAGAAAQQLFDLFERSTPHFVTPDITIALMVCLSESGPEFLPQMVANLHRFTANTPGDTACAALFSIVITTALRAPGQRGVGWQIYDMFMTMAAVPLDDVQFASIVTECATPAELVRVHQNFLEKGVVANCVVWANTFKAIAHMPEHAALAMHFFRMMGSVGHADQVSCNAAINCLDQLEDAAVVTAFMAEQKIAFDSFYFFAVLGVAQRARSSAAVATQIMRDYVQSEAGWFDGMWRRFAGIVGTYAAQQFEREHGELLNAKRAAPVQARAVVPLHPDAIDRKGERKRARFIASRRTFATQRQYDYAPTRATNQEEQQLQQQQQ